MTTFHGRIVQLVTSPWTAEGSCSANRSTTSREGVLQQQVHAATVTRSEARADPGRLPGVVRRQA